MQTPHNMENADQFLQWQSRLVRIKEYVSANLAAYLSSRTVSEKFGLNEATLRHLFQKQEDESFHDYVERMRMAKALQLLSEGKWGERGDSGSRI